MGRKSMMAVTAVAALGLMAGSTIAGTNQARTITGGKAASDTPAASVEQVKVQTSVRVVRRPVVEPDATVSRQLSEQPVRPHLAEVRIADQRIYIDPDQLLRTHADRGIDRNHSLLRAQRAFRDMTQTRPARVITAPRRDAEADDASASHSGPKAIFFSPRVVPQAPSPDDRGFELPDVRDEPEQPKERGPIPSVPVSPERKAGPSLVLIDLMNY